jgi:hypothetical protein
LITEKRIASQNRADQVAGEMELFRRLNVM